MFFLSRQGYKFITLIIYSYCTCAFKHVMELFISLNPSHACKFQLLILDFFYPRVKIPQAKKN